MNTKKIVFALVASISLLAVSCTSSTASDDEVYEQGIDKSKFTKKI